jgi:hypothetical protein
MIALAPLATMAISAGPVFAEELVTEGVSFVPDRELLLTVSDNFQRQRWLYAGQRYAEEGKFIVVNENECIHLILINDTDRVQSLSLDEAHITLAARKSCKRELIVADLQPKILSNPAAGISRTIQVRPAYQRHAALLA